MGIWLVKRFRFFITSCVLLVQWWHRSCLVFLWISINNFQYIKMTWAKLMSIMLVAFWFYMRTVYTISKEHRQLDKFVRHLMKCRGIPGLSLSVVKDGRPFYTKGYGHGDLQNWTDVNENTMFCTGSITKGFTATLMAMVIGNNSR